MILYKLADVDKFMAVKTKQKMKEKIDFFKTQNVTWLIKQIVFILWIPCQDENSKFL